MYVVMHEQQTHTGVPRRRGGKFMKFVHACGKVSFFEHLRSHEGKMSTLGRVTDVKWRGPLDAFDALHLVSLIKNHPTIVKLRLPAAKVFLTSRSRTILADGFKLSNLVFRLGGSGMQEKLNVKCNETEDASKIEKALAKMCKMTTDKGPPLEFVSFEEKFACYPALK
jgi:hypothetical protein